MPGLGALATVFGNVNPSRYKRLENRVGAVVNKARFDATKYCPRKVCKVRYYEIGGTITTFYEES